MDSKNSILRALIIIAALVGVGIMSYLLYMHYAPTPEGGSFCDIAEGFSCDVVNKSAYSEVLGIPMSAFGILYFALVAYLSIFRYSPQSLTLIAFLMVALLGPSLYLSGYVSGIVLKNFCIMCESSKALMLLIAILALAAVGGKQFGGKRFALALASAVVLALATYGIHSAIVTEPLSYKGNLSFSEAFKLIFQKKEKAGEYNAFAQCLTEKGMKMYGSITCHFCAQQRAIFGKSFEYVKEIECDPRNENVEIERCLAKKIERTPTWILEDSDGNTLLEKGSGVKTFEELSEISGCPLVKDSDATGQNHETAQ